MDAMNTQPSHHALSTTHHTNGALSVAHKNFRGIVPDPAYIVLTWTVGIWHNYQMTPLIGSILNGLPTFQMDVQRILNLSFLPHLRVQFMQHGVQGQQEELNISNTSALLRIMRDGGCVD